MKIIDLRSDTVTKPTPEMRRAMFEAEVGDDVYGDDPTVNRLEAEAAVMLGKEAAMFVPSGTQGNQIAIMTHTRRGEEVIVEAGSHVYIFEVGGIATLSGCQARPIAGVRGAMDPAQVAAAIRSSNVHFPTTSLVCVEQTYNGCVVPMENIRAIAEIAHQNGIAVHMDGARVFNAATALGLPVSEVVAPVDSVQLCLSKGLAAPVGSLLAGTKEFIDRARRNRKLLGGGLRQVGILAAAGLISLHKMTKRLHEDHENARQLALGLAKIPGLSVDLDSVQTNMVFFDVLDQQWDGASLAGSLTRAGVVCNASGARGIRWVTHNDVPAEAIPEVLSRVEAVMAAGPDHGASATIYG